MSFRSGAIKDYALGIYDGPHATPKESDDGHIFLGIKNVTPDGRLDFSDIKYVSDQEFPRWTKRVTPTAGDVVFSYEATLHRYGVIPEGFDGCLGRRMGLVRPDPKKLLSRYLHFYFLSPGWKSYADTKVIVGATVNRLPIKDFPDFEVKFPPLEVQQRVVDVLGAYDDLIENNRRRIALLEESARLLYKEWFIHLRFPGHEQVKVVDGVPEGWKKGIISDFFDSTSGGTPSRKVPEYYTGDINWVKTQELNELFILEADEKITEEAISKSAAKLFPVGTLLVAIYGGTNIGRTGLLAAPSASNQACVAFFPRRRLEDNLFLQKWVQEHREYLIGLSQGAAQTNISQQTLKALDFIMPKHSMLDEFIDYILPIYDQIKI